MSEPKWLSAAEQQAWRAFLNGSAWLQEALNNDLEVESDLSLNEYEILVRLSEAPERRVRMSVLAEHPRHSPSRLPPTIARMPRQGRADPAPRPEGGARGEAGPPGPGSRAPGQASPGP